MNLARALAALVLLVAPAQGSDQGVLESKPFDLQGHRGARGLAPENTLAAFAKALAIGVSTLELDLGMTRDGVLVVHHDARLNPDTTRGPDGQFLSEVGPAIRSLTFAELSGYDVGRLKPRTPYGRRLAAQEPADGARIPRLAEVFDLVRRAGADHIRFNIETKLAPGSHDSPEPEPFAQAVAEAVRAAGMERRVIVQSFDWRTLKAFEAIAPDLARSCLTSEGHFDTMQKGVDGPSPWTAGLDIDRFGGSVTALVKGAGCHVWSPSFRDLTEERLSGAKELGLAVIPWTVNAPENMARLIDWGVDGLITDYPDRARAVMAAKGLPLPPPVALR
ncbi:MAG TPA: glycerophosphodiester phosphodiesterase [Beijerinckiaceae bacterium]|nr:glycerophosphodiester phosphodiesterase [Beijerinckiaceae bacterium]